MAHAGREWPQVEAINHVGGSAEAAHLGVVGCWAGTRVGLARATNNV